MVVLPYKDSLLLFSRYLQQLVMESLGKEFDLDGNRVYVKSVDISSGFATPFRLVKSILSIKLVKIYFCHREYFGSAFQKDSKM